MQDIVPAEGRVRKIKKTARRDQVVQLQYKLPARLRRPISRELRDNRHREQMAASGVDFERRPIRTEPTNNRPPSYRKNIGVEHHTGDVYMRSRPEIQVSAPPYVSAVAKRGRTAIVPIRQKMVDRRKKKGGYTSVNTGRRQGQREQRQTVVAKANPGAMGLSGVRDLPYEFNDNGGQRNSGGRAVAVRMNTKQPRVEGLVLQPAAKANWTEMAGRGRKQPLSDDGKRMGRLYSTRRGVKEREEKSDSKWRRAPAEAKRGWPGQGMVQQPSRYLSKPTLGLAQTGREIKAWIGAVFNRQVAMNAVILIVGCGLAYGVIWNLHGLGRGWQVMGSVRDRAVEAYSSLVAASSALAETDFAASEAGFSDAAKLIQEAQTELEGAMASSQALLRWVDVTGTVRSGQEILAAGEQLSLAGGYLAQGANQLLTGQEGRPFTTAVTGAKVELVQAEEALAKAEKSLRRVNGIFLSGEIGQQIESIADSTARIRLMLKGFIDRSDVLLSMMGAERDKQYLLLFQNNHEIRPTGGFIGSIGLVNIDRGNVEAIDINSVYDPDGQLKEYIEPPEPLKAVTNRWYLRDANWFVDFSASARKVIGFFEKEGGPTVDGVIALTPEVIRELIRVTGPIPMPGYDVEVNYDNFWLVTQDKVSYSYDKQRNEPKKFLADLAPLLLDKLLSGDANSSLEALEGIVRMIEEKQLLVYLNNSEWQARLTEIGWSGDLPAEQPALLAVNNANIAGHKSDQFIEQEIDYRLEVMKDGTTEAVVMIKREHRGNVEKPDYEYPAEENPATKDNIVYQRVLVPKGAKLLEAEGFSAPADIPKMAVPEDYEYMRADEDVVDWQTGQWEHESGTVVGEEAGYTFFGNWVVTKPGKTTIAFYRYRLPEAADQPGVLNPAGSLGAYVVKQPGDMRTTIRVQIDLPASMRIVHTVPAAGITQENDQTVVYRGALRKDIITGVVFAEAYD